MYNFGNINHVIGTTAGGIMQHRGMHRLKRWLGDDLLNDQNISCQNLSGSYQLRGTIFSLHGAKLSKAKLEVPNRGFFRHHLSASRCEILLSSGFSRFAIFRPF